MICHELDQRLYPYLDGEYAPPERLDVEAHLTACADCSGRVASERHIQATLQARIEETAASAPESLRAALLANLKLADRHVQRASWLRWGATALLAAAAGVSYFSLRPDPRDRFMDDAALRYSRRLPYEVEGGNPAAVEAWFDGKLDYRVPVPRLSHATLAGARLSNLKEREAAYIGYQAAGLSDAALRRVGVFVMDDSAEELSTTRWPDVQVREARGYRVASWRSGGMVYELVSDLDEPSIRRLLSAEPPAFAHEPAFIPPQATQVVPASLRR